MEVISRQTSWQETALRRNKAKQKAHPMWLPHQSTRTERRQKPEFLNTGSPTQGIIQAGLVLLQQCLSLASDNHLCAKPLPGLSSVWLSLSLNEHLSDRIREPPCSIPSGKKKKKKNFQAQRIGKETHHRLGEGINLQSHEPWDRNKGTIGVGRNGGTGDRTQQRDS